ncbi:MAG: YihA family ribosome biogenesis GTP-binding protein [Bacteroidetes bacterium]|nr:YihA family ribosome biogenesis GTP-binding protein [Bacteroidota bacterium]
MIVQSATFIKSIGNISACPETGFPEYAFIGRSNVGKSSLINLLTTRKDLAKISSTPGKTKLINYFLINDQWYLVDLPGYGYARLDKKQRQQLTGMINHYLLSSKNLVCVFLLVDVRLEPQKQDLFMMEWMATNQIPFVIAYTKCDKLSRGQLSKNLEVYRKHLEPEWEEIPTCFLTSAVSHIGKEEILDYIDQLNNQDLRD